MCHIIDRALLASKLLSQVLATERQLSQVGATFPPQGRAVGVHPARALAAAGVLRTPARRLSQSVVRENIAMTTGAFLDAARFAGQAADLARGGGDLADASLQLTVVAGGHLLVGDAPGAVPLAREALALARQTGAPALVAAGLLAVGATVAGADPEQARACLRESRELSTALGYQSALDHVWATAIAFFVGDQVATLELGRGAIRALQWGGDRLRMGLVLHFIAGAFAPTRPEAAAIIQGAAEAYVVQPPVFALPSSAVTAALGDQRARELRARGADIDWDQALAYTLAQTTDALNGPESKTQP